MHFLHFFIYIQLFLYRKILKTPPAFQDSPGLVRWKWRTPSHVGTKQNELPSLLLELNQLPSVEAKIIYSLYSLFLVIVGEELCGNQITVSPLYIRVGQFCVIQTSSQVRYGISTKVLHLLVLSLPLGYSYLFCSIYFKSLGKKM